MYRRHQWRIFPFFFLYVVTVAINDAIRLDVGFLFGGSAHFYAYYFTDAINIGISFLVLYEVLEHILTSGTIKISRSTFFLFIAILFLVAATLAYFTVDSRKDPIINAIFLAEGSVRFAQVGVLLMFVVLTIFYGFYWGSQAFGISAGFGFYASVVLVNLYILKHLGRIDSKRFGFTDVSAYILATAIWLVYSLKQNKAIPPNLPEDKLSEFKEPLDRFKQ